MAGVVVAHVDDKADVLVLVVDACDLVAENAVHFSLDLLAEGQHLAVHSFVKFEHVLTGVEFREVFLVNLELRFDDCALFFL